MKVLPPSPKATETQSSTARRWVLSLVWLNNSAISACELQAKFRDPSLTPLIAGVPNVANHLHPEGEQHSRAPHTAHLLPSDSRKTVNTAAAKVKDEASRFLPSGNTPNRNAKRHCAVAFETNRSGDFGIVKMSGQQRLTQPFGNLDLSNNKDPVIKSINDTKAEYRRLGKSGLRVSVPILGAMSFGDPAWWASGNSAVLVSLLTT